MHPLCISWLRGSRFGRFCSDLGPGLIRYEPGRTFWHRCQGHKAALERRKEPGHQSGRRYPTSLGLLDSPRAARSSRCANRPPSRFRWRSCPSLSIWGSSNLPDSSELGSQGLSWSRLFLRDPADDERGWWRSYLAVLAALPAQVMEPSASAEQTLTIHAFGHHVMPFCLSRPDSAHGPLGHQGEGQRWPRRSRISSRSAEDADFCRSGL